MIEHEKFQSAQNIKQKLLKTWELTRKHFYPEGRRIRYRPYQSTNTNDEQPYTVENSGNKYTVKGGELRKKLASTVMEMMFPKYANWVSIKWTKESAKSILRKYNEIEQEIGGEQELPPVVDLFKEMQDGFDNVAEDAIIKMNKSESKIIATTVCDLLITYGWCVLIPYESGIKIANMDNTYLVANNDRVTNIFTTYYVTYADAHLSQKTERIEFCGTFFRNTENYKYKIIENTEIHENGEQTCRTFLKSISEESLISQMYYTKNQPNLIVQTWTRPNRDDPYSVSPAMYALPIYAKVNKLEKLQQELAQIATWGIFAKKQQGHIDLEDNFYVKTQDDTAVHLYKGDNAPVNLVNSGANELVAGKARDDYYAELAQIFLITNMQIGKTPPSAEQIRANEEQFQSDKQGVYNMLKTGFNHWYYYYINSIFEENIEDILEAYSGLVPSSFLIDQDSLIDNVSIEYKSVFDFNVKIQTLQSFMETTQVISQLLGVDYAQATVNQSKLMELIKDINTDDELINSSSQIQEILEQIQQARLDEAQSHINPEEVQKNK
jgi:hypothetical protein